MSVSLDTAESLAAIREELRKIPAFFRRGGSAVGLVAFLLVVSSTSYFPVDVLPAWVQPIVDLNPLTITLEGLRGALLGGQGWEALWPALLGIIPLSAASMMAGMAAFRLALRRERRRGTLGLY